VEQMLQKVRSLEDAGVVGEIGKKSPGSFSHKKLLKEDRGIVRKVHVFPLDVTRQRKTWPEKGKREVHGSRRQRRQGHPRARSRQNDSEVAESEK
jgi:hypothetical protein